MRFLEDFVRIVADPQSGTKQSLSMKIAFTGQLLEVSEGVASK